MDTLLSISLACSVPLRIAEYQSSGGPAPEDIERARRFGSILGSKGDVLLYRGKKPGETAELFNALSDALAVMAFCLGGVKAFGSHWEAKT